LGILSVAPFHAYSHFLQFRVSNAPESVNLGMINSWIAVISAIWSHKNKIIFKGGVFGFF